MIFGVFDDYVDLAALGKIAIAVLLVSVIVPVAFSTAIIGEGRRKQGGTATAGGTVMVGVGVLVVVAAVIVGIWAMTSK
jgi:hypothetical protein